MTVQFSGPAAGGVSGLPRGYIDGLILSNDGGAPTTTVDFAAGVARNSTNIMDLANNAAFTKVIQAAGAFAAGTGGNGLDTGARAASTWYHCFILGPSNDFLFSLSPTAPALPAGFTVFRRIGAVMTDAGNNILTFVQTGDLFLWSGTAVTVDFTTSTLGVTVASATVKSPLGLKTGAIIQNRVSHATATAVCSILSPDQTDLAPVSFGVNRALVVVLENYNVVTVLTDTSSQVLVRSNQNNTTLKLTTFGWIDPRGTNV